MDFTTPVNGVNNMALNFLLFWQTQVRIGANVFNRKVPQLCCQWSNCLVQYLSTIVVEMLLFEIIIPHLRFLRLTSSRNTAPLNST